jgi:hypothetical protein
MKWSAKLFQMIREEFDLGPASNIDEAYLEVTLSIPMA